MSQWITAKIANPRKELCGMMDKVILAGNAALSPSTSQSNLPALMTKIAMDRAPLCRQI